MEELAKEFLRSLLFELASCADPVSWRGCPWKALSCSGALGLTGGAGRGHRLFLSLRIRGDLAARAMPRRQHMQACQARWRCVPCPFTAAWELEIPLNPV